MTLISRRARVRASLTFVALVAALPAAATAQSTGAHFEVHANQDVSAERIGLPEFPGARASHDSSEDANADVGFDLGDVHFRLLVSKFITSRTTADVLAFYRKPLAHYGDVIECVGGQPYGPITSTRGGLTCDNEQTRDHVHTETDTHELRAGTHERFRIVAVEPGRIGGTEFTLLLMEVPKNTSSGDR